MKNKEVTHWVGVLEVLGSGLCFGFLGIFGKMGFQSGLKPGELLALRFCLASLFMWLITFVLARKSIKLKPKEILLCLSMGILGYAVFSSCYFAALNGISASLTSLLLFTFPVMVTLGAHFFLNETITRRQWLALPIVSVGLFFLVWGDFSINKSLSFLFGVSAAFFYSIYILISKKKMGGINTMVATSYIQTGAALALSLFYLNSPSHAFELFRNSWLPILEISVISTVLPMALYLNGLKKLNSSEAAVLSTVEPVTAVVAAALFLGERMLPLQYLGGALVMSGLLMTSLKNFSKKRLHSLK